MPPGLLGAAEGGRLQGAQGKKEETMWIRISRVDGSETECTEVEVRRALDGYYRRIPETMRDAKSGGHLMTTFNLYEWRA